MNAEATGVLARGRAIEVPGLTVINSRDVAWCRLDGRDYRKRRGTGLAWIRQVVVHTTKGTWPQHVKPGKSTGGRARNAADYWSTSTVSGGCHFIVDNDGKVYCLADVIYDEAYHATTSNPWSIGIEMYQEGDGGIYQAVLEATVRLVDFLCNELEDDSVGIPFQIPDRRYNNDAIDRLKFDGGPSFAGVIGHRDQAWDFKKHTSSRGRGDPGEDIYVRLVDAGAERVDVQGMEDLKIGRLRQAHLNELGELLVVDGGAGPRSIQAARRHGFRRWCEVPLA